MPIGPKQTHPDFVVLHPRRGLLILETKDWRLDTNQTVLPDEKLLAEELEWTRWELEARWAARSGN